MNRKLCKIVSIVILISSSTAFAEYNSEKLGQAIGSYITATDMFEKFTKSECGYAVKRSYSFASSLNETMPYLNNQDREEIKNFIQTNEFKKKLIENNEYINGFMHAGMKDGLDKKTLCGMLLSNTASLYQYSLTQWNYAKKHYAK